ncbi:coiled-coil domain-containing protein 80-like [Venturia canescens]|uniref:coiled-coil domain-containing protein 80-like n=1 Tax=Venturia canescens TaxID=32260 RepID=UPI001C9C37DF|nr:coiled-coil domain-containing protein 80-like [Venturia canescens]XP_043282100.1 coiled-coil domain-containing protein 80-like [Venturia canescens]
MQHECYKLCPRVREQLRKAREAEETSDDSESGSYEGIEGVAGPSGVRRRGSESSSHYSLDQPNKKREQLNKRPPTKRNESTRRKKEEKVVKKRDREAQGPSKNRRKRKGEDSRKNETANCDRNCRGIGQPTTKIKNKKRQETFDEYIINKGLCYFEDLCNCSYACFINQLWKDSFVTSTIASAALFAIGLKLCCEMDGWSI